MNVSIAIMPWQNVDRYAVMASVAGAYRLPLNLGPTVFWVHENPQRTLDDIQVTTLYVGLKQSLAGSWIGLCNCGVLNIVSNEGRCREIVIQRKTECWAVRSAKNTCDS